MNNNLEPDEKSLEELLDEELREQARLAKLASEFRFSPRRSHMIPEFQDPRQYLLAGYLAASPEVSTSNPHKLLDFAERILELIEDEK